MMSMINREAAVDRHTKEKTIVIPANIVAVLLTRLCAVWCTITFLQILCITFNLLGFKTKSVSYANATNCVCIPSMNGTTEKYCQAITFFCIQYQDHVYIKLGHYDNSNANIRDDKYLAT